MWTRAARRRQTGGTVGHHRRQDQDLSLIKDGVGGCRHLRARALDASELPHGIVRRYQHAARHAVTTAGFDGVEVHGANGYLMTSSSRPAATAAPTTTAASRTAPRCWR